MTEARIQQECFQWLWNNYPNLRKRLFMVHNTPKNAIDGARLRGMGMVAGVSDLIFLRDNLPPLCIEMKDDSGRQTPAQIEWQKIATACGCEYVVVRSLDEFQTVLTPYLR